MQKIKLVYIPGDGIGPEIVSAVKFIFDKANLPLEWIEAQAGLSSLEQGGDVLPQRTLDLIKEHHLALKGPTSTPSGTGHQSINVLLRKHLGLYANVRPCASISSHQTRYAGIDLVIVRENLEDTYSGIEYMQSADLAQGLKIISRSESERVIRFAFEYALKNGRKEVCCIHKANIHKFTDGLFLKTFEQVQRDYPEIKARDLIVDNACMQLVTRPETFDVLVAPNLYGDIISDLCAGLVGGLGVAPSANIGSNACVFEAVHGSAPDIAGKNIANPSALLLSALMLLRYVGLNKAAESIHQAFLKTLSLGSKTKDLGGQLSTQEFADTIVGNFEAIDLSFSQPIEDLYKKFSLQQQKMPNVKAKVFGIDLYVTTGEYPNIPSEIGAFKLEGISNRGVKLADKNDGDFLTDTFCLRFLLTNKLVEDIKNEEFSVLIEKIASLGLNWVHIEKLQQFDENKGFSDMK